ncbi:hypothetical protein LUZ60_017770 [Juncus effusus]|nr:hypothetical protein LUZ60_017770 [Juncus effusus]
MLPYSTLAEAEVMFGRSLTASEMLWFSYSSRMPDYILYYHNILFFYVFYSLVPLPLALLELWAPQVVSPYKIQRNVNLKSASVFQCYKNVVYVFLLAVWPLQAISYPMIKLVGIRTSLPLPSLGEMAAQLAVYFLIEDYFNYWIHRLLHSKWGYEKIHKVHHEFSAPIGFAAPYAHWAEVLILGIPSFLGPAIAPCHMITFWLWFVLRQVEAIDTHSGYDFPLNLTKCIPFYGGADYHDYHHYIGGQSQSNFASVFTYCDYIYGTDKGYRYHKAHLAKLKELKDGIDAKRV